MKKVLVLNDLSCIGRSSLMVNIPLISSYHHQVIPLVTTTLNKHTAFKDSIRINIDDSFNQIIDSFIQHKENFDWILIGYLGRRQQVDKIIELIQCYPDAKVVFDPVCADNGKLYTGMDLDYVQALKKLLLYAHYITPNIYEAAFLCNRKVNAINPLNADEIFTQLKSLTNGNIIITGIKKNDSIICLYEDNLTLQQLSSPIIDITAPGSGDAFVSVLISYLMNEQPLDTAIKKAMNYVYQALDYLKNNQIDPINGLMIETTIKQACQ